jgi:signal transduction histidine kinase
MPQAFPGDFGIPRKFQLDGATLSDFSDASVLLEVHFDGVYQTGPIMEWAFPVTRCRYVRLVATEPYVYFSERVKGNRIGFAEVELLGAEGNVAYGKAVVTDFRLSSDPDSRVALTDGYNLYGAILPIRDWLEQLALRRDLEAERPVVAEELSRRYAQQKEKFQLLIWIVVLLALMIALTVFYYRMARQRQESRIRERISANLHDELGANLHAIGLLGDLAKDAVDCKEDLIDTVDRMRALTVRTGMAASNCANLLGADGFCEDLIFEMKQDVAHLLGDLQHSLEVEGEAVLTQLRRRTRLDLYLFYKEALTNIIRHSGATRVTTKLIADSKYIRLTVTDNGYGLKDSQPKALIRRARLLRGELSIEKPATGSGTRVNLVIKNRKFGFL